MTKREARIEALRLAVALLNNCRPFYNEAVIPEDETKIFKELDVITDSLYNRAAKLGGDFNEFTGYVDDTDIIVSNPRHSFSN